MPVDPNSGLPMDPAIMQQLQQQNLVKGVDAAGGSAATRMDNMAIGQSISSLFPSPQVQQNAAMQQAVQTAVQGIGQQGTGESDIDYSMRRLKAQRDAITPYSPEGAATLDTQLLKLQESKVQQAHLGAETQRLSDENAAYAAGAPERANAQTLANIDSKTAYVATRTPGGQEPWTSQAFDISTPEGAAAYVKAKQAPNSEGYSAAAFQKLFDQGATADSALLRSLAEAQRKVDTANGDFIDPELAKRYLADRVWNPTYAARMQGKPEGAAADKMADTLGITPADEFAGRMELQAATTGERAAANRVGNIQVLQKEMPGAANLVMQSLANVDRGSIQMLNHGIAIGATQFGSEAETTYAASIQTFINAYARVISGGTGRSTVSAQNEARTLLEGKQSPEQVKGVLDLLANKEMAVLSKAGDGAIEAIANPNQYPHLMKLMDKMGYAPFPTQGDEAATRANGTTPPTTPVPGAAVGGTATGSGLAPGWTVVPHQ